MLSCEEYLPCECGIMYQGLEEEQDVLIFPASLILLHLCSDLCEDTLNLSMYFLGDGLKHFIGRGVFIRMLFIMFDLFIKIRLLQLFKNAPELPNFIIACLGFSYVQLQSTRILSEAPKTSPQVACGIDPISHGTEGQGSWDRAAHMHLEIVIS